MPASKAQQKAVNKYMATNYDRVNLTMPKGRKAIIQTAAAAAGESVNSYINGAIDDRMVQEGAIALSIEGAVYLPSKTIKTAQEAAEAVGEALPQFIGRAIEETADRDALEGGEQNADGKGL